MFTLQCPKKASSNLGYLFTVSHSLTHLRILLAKLQNNLFSQICFLLHLKGSTGQDKLLSALANLEFTAPDFYSLKASADCEIVLRFLCVAHSIAKNSCNRGGTSNRH